MKLYPLVIFLICTFFALSFVLRYMSSKSPRTSSSTTTITTTIASLSTSSSSFLPEYHHPDQLVNVTALAGAIVQRQRLLSHHSSKLSLLHRIPEDIYHVRVLKVINSFNMKQFRAMLEILNATAGYCEFGWHATVVLHTSVNYTQESLTQIRQRSYCRRLQAPINHTIQRFPESLKFRVSKMHRAVFKQELNNYDLFVYCEDDMILYLRHCLLFYYELTFFSGTWIPGFYRYQYVDGYVRNLAAEDFFYYGYCEVKMMQGNWYWVPNNPYSAFTVLTRGQLLVADTNCGYLVAPNVSYFFVTPGEGYPEYMGGYQIYLHCGLLKLVPMHNFSYFLKFAVLHHSTHYHYGFDDDQRLLETEYKDITACIIRATRRNLTHLKCELGRKRPRKRGFKYKGSRKTKNHDYMMYVPLKDS